MVASISASTSAAYYLKADYYLGGSSNVGWWHGVGAALLGYSGQILADELRNAFAGRTPDGATSLVQVQPDKKRQPAWDITFSAPKSVSVLWSVLDGAQRSRIEALLMKATARAVDYLDAEALKTRRGKDGWRVESAKGVYALCPHATSRAFDPQLHVHALAMNLCNRDDGTTGTIKSEDLYWHKMAAGALFRLELAHLLQCELGLTLAKDRWSFHVEGVPQKLCDEQSKRRHAIEEIAKEEGWNSARALAALALTSRKAKAELSLEDCFERWQREGAAHNFTSSAAIRLLAAGAERLNANTIAKEADLKLLTEKAVSSLATSKAYFTERDLICKAAVFAQGTGASASQIIEAVKRQVASFEYRVEKERAFYPYFSTTENIVAEEELLERAYQTEHSASHIASTVAVQYALEKVERKLSKKLGVQALMTNDQIASLRHITLESGSLKIVQGYAGAGKTQMLEAAAHAWKKSGFRVFGTAITGRAAHGLATTTGMPCVTIAQLLRRLRPDLPAPKLATLCGHAIAAAVKDNYYEGIRAGHWVRRPFRQAYRESADWLAGQFDDKARARCDINRCKLTPKTILVVDEAAMLPTQTLLALKQECDLAGAKLVLVGDQLQLPPIEAGGPFWSLANRIKHASMTTITRQERPWMKEAVSLLINDQPRQALELYAANDALTLAKHQSGAIMKLIFDYGRLEASAYGRAIALTATNEEARRINGGVQAYRKGAKQLGVDFVRLPNGERVYRNDRVLLTKNDYGLDVRNGLLGTVVKVHHSRGIVGLGAVSVQLDQPRGVKGLSIVTIDLATYGNIQLGYAATTHKAQGITVEKSFVLLGEEMLSKERAFTQLTRASKDSMLYGTEAQYGDTLQLLAQQISKQTAKDLAHDHTVKLQREHGYELSLQRK